MSIERKNNKNDHSSPEKVAKTSKPQKENSFLKEGLHQFIWPVLGLMILISAKDVSVIISNQIKNPFWNIISLLACIVLSLLAGLQYYRHKLKQAVLNEYCQNCVQTLVGEVINAYNLFTYDQLLKIEESVGQESGDNRCVYCYSTFRDDGDEVGVPEAEKVIRTNQAKGVKYYNIYYKEPSGLQPNQDFVNEVFINLSETEELSNGAAEACLDYRFYHQIRFDIMIYQWDIDRIEGYFCLNFPLRQTCNYYSSCPYSCNDPGKARTERVFYKKMSPIITEDLLRRLRDVAKKEGKLL